MFEKKWEKGFLRVEEIIVVFVLFMGVMFVAMPVISPWIKEADAKERLAFQQEADTTANVIILEKEVVTKNYTGPRGTTSQRSYRIIMFEYKGEEYYSNVSSDFFNGLKQNGTMKIYIKEEKNKIMGEAPSGQTEFLTRY